MHGDPRDDGGRADEGKDTNRVEKKRVNVCDGEKGRCDRVKEEILLKVMNVSLSFLLYDPGAFANYPDIQRSDPARLPTG